MHPTLPILLTTLTLLTSACSHPKSSDHTTNLSDLTSDTLVRLHFNPREYTLDNSLRLTLDPDGSATLHFQNNTTRSLYDEFFALMVDHTKIHPTTPAFANLLESTRLPAATAHLIPQVALEVIAEQNTPRRQATDLAQKWLTTKSIPIIPQNPASHPFLLIPDPPVYTLTESDLTTLQNALAGTPPTLKPPQFPRSQHPNGLTLQPPTTKPAGLK